MRSSAQGLFNLLILGVGNVAASFLFPALMGRLQDRATGAVDYQSLFLVPTGMALAAVLLLALFFRPPSGRRPASVAAVMHRNRRRRPVRPTSPDLHRRAFLAAGVAPRP